MVPIGGIGKDDGGNISNIQKVFGGLGKILLFLWKTVVCSEIYVFSIYLQMFMPLNSFKDQYY